MKTVCDKDSLIFQILCFFVNLVMTQPGEIAETRCFRSSGLFFVIYLFPGIFTLEFEFFNFKHRKTEFTRFIFQITRFRGINFLLN